MIDLSDWTTTEMVEEIVARGYGDDDVAARFSVDTVDELRRCAAELDAYLKADGRVTR